MSVIDEAIREAGGLQAVADYFGVRYQAVQKWRKKLPPERAAGLEELTGGKFTRQQLCPNFPWAAEAIPHRRRRGKADIRKAAHG